MTKEYLKRCATNSLLDYVSNYIYVNEGDFMQLKEVVLPRGVLVGKK